MTFLAFEDSLRRTLSGVALCLSVLTAVVLWLFVKHRDTPIVKADNRALSYVLLISPLLCFLCSLLFPGRPNNHHLHPPTDHIWGCVHCGCFHCSGQNHARDSGLQSHEPGRTRHRLVSGASNGVIAMGSLIQVIFCGVWLGTSPPLIDIDTHSEPRNLIIVSSKGSVTAFSCVLGYLGSLGLGSFSLAFLTRNLPDTFSEAKCLTSSMLVFCSVWVTFLPVHHSTKGKVMVAVEIFSILASSAGLLGCIFAPKCYIILLRPDKNSLKVLRNRIGSRRNRHSGFIS
ncbi:hypothetical protein mRhiFer1_008624 [Rhinolophus ferrumequinum]|uniref:G-protein coupled receptors family 3 profile domain-containing protein n=1 Tax=Rhinolophus ferrumequinum TaxID=59479 RepID=A0A7J7U0W9_RHIFE|nr:hypothetical protein mRhiFer1_008624 [Rhinolophus ferrumequinum]